MLFIIVLQATFARGMRELTILAIINWAGTINSIAAIGRFNFCLGARNRRQIRGIRFAP
jgi:hypothetical protein